MPNVKGTAGLMYTQYYSGEGFSGVFNVTGRGGADGESGSGRSHQGKVWFDSSTGQTNADGTTYVSQADSVYKDGGEVRPANFTVRVWRRTG